MRYVIKFSKEGMLRYTSHLDMIRFFKRVFKRADIDLEYSHGFNPHPKMTFAQPLSLGYTGINEILEIETKDDIKPETICKRMNEEMPEGMIIKSCDYLPEAGKGIAAKIEEAEYQITIDQDINLSQDDIEEFLRADSIVVLKKQKKKKELKEVNIRSKIRSVTLKKIDNKIIMTTRLDCGSQSNLNPELLLQGIKNYFNIEISPENVEIQRNYLK